MVALLAALPCIVLVVYAGILQMQAAAILKGVYALKVGHSSRDDVEQMASRIDRGLWSKECEGGRCDFGFSIYNTWLHRMRLEPIALFQAEVTVEKEIVQRIHVSLMRDTGVYPTHPSAGKVTEYVEYPDSDWRWKAYEFPQPIGKPYLDVHLNHHATSEQRQRAYAFSLTCLTKPGSGCDLPCDYLPLAWKDWIPTWENKPLYTPYYPTRARCK